MKYIKLFENFDDKDYTEQLLSLINSNNETNLSMVKEMASGLGIDLFEFIKDNIDRVEPPYFYKFQKLGMKLGFRNIKKIDNITEKSKNVSSFKNGISVKNNKGDIIYSELWDGSWMNIKYNESGKKIYKEFSDGVWYKWEYDEAGNEIYCSDSYGDWIKREYDEDGNIIYYLDNYGKTFKK